MIEHINKTLIIPREHHNQRIDLVLASLLPDYSRSQISSWIKHGSVKRNDQCCKPKEKVANGDIIHINVDLTAHDASFATCAPENLPLDIIFEDDEVLVLNKPAGLVVHPGAGNKEHTLVNALLHHCPTLKHIPRAGIVHRLDKDTTGLLIVAKTLPAHTSLVCQLQERTIKRHYATLVQGYLISGGTIDTFYGRHPKNRLKMAVTMQGKQAITDYFIKKHYQHFTLLEVQLHTGRTHQIRVHMAHIHHPVIGDPLYGSKRQWPQGISPVVLEKLVGFKRQALHAKSITFTHPKSNKPLTFTAPLPDDFQQLLNSLDNEDDI
jgi:23S rRNA pseudouridine1911/1915/1917 synthase